MLKKVAVAALLLLSLVVVAAGMAAKNDRTPEQCLRIPEIMPGQNQPAQRQPSIKSDSRGGFKLMADKPSQPRVCPTDRAVVGAVPGQVREFSDDSSSG